MKRLKKIALVAVLLLMLPVAASAWEVKIVNKTDQPMQIWIQYIYGFFQVGEACWNEWIKKGDTKVCGIPAPNCAYLMKWAHSLSECHASQTIGIGLPSPSATCWNVEITIKEDGNGNITYSRVAY